MKTPRKTLPLLAVLTGGLALATAPPVHAPASGYRLLRPDPAVPADRYLDLGALPALRTEVGYTSPLHPWQRAGAGAPGTDELDEARYVDVGARSLRSFDP